MYHIRMQIGRGPVKKVVWGVLRAGRDAKVGAAYLMVGRATGTASDDGVLVNVTTSRPSITCTFR